jgi:hypothetical protein
MRISRCSGSSNELLIKAEHGAVLMCTLCCCTAVPQASCAVDSYRCKQALLLPTQVLQLLRPLLHLLLLLCCRSEYNVSSDLNVEQDENFQQQQQQQQLQQHEYETSNSGYKSDTSAIARPNMSECCRSFDCFVSCAESYQHMGCTSCVVSVKLTVYNACCTLTT